MTSSGINFKLSTFSSAVQASYPRNPTVGPETLTGSIDGFQASVAHNFSSPTFTTASTPINFTVSRDQLTSSAFQQTLSTLASAGNAVTITLVCAKDAAPQFTNHTPAR